MEWNEVSIMPKDKYGWFAVAVVPKNHSGTNCNDKCSIEGDNSWRDKFGFTKAWLNNGEWWEPNATGFRCDNITELVTHWSKLPSVPKLLKSHDTPEMFRINKPVTKEKLLEYGENILKSKTVNYDRNSFLNGFIEAFKEFGII